MTLDLDCPLRYIINAFLVILKYKSIYYTPVEFEGYLWLVCVEVVSTNTSDGFYMHVVIMKHFLIKGHCILHVI